MKVTLAKTLKLKNRIVKKIQEVSLNIQAYNSMMVGQERPDDVNALMETRSKLMDALINLKTSLSKANEQVQSTIYLLAEIKGDLVFLKGIDTTSGKQIQNSGWGPDVKFIEKTAILDYKTVQGLIKQAEADIDINQDILDKHNHTVEIEVSDDVMNLIRN